MENTEKDQIEEDANKADSKKEEAKITGENSKKNKRSLNLIQVDERPLWQQRRQQDDDSFGVYSDMMA